jgi:hypothetical protein
MRGPALAASSCRWFLARPAIVQQSTQTPCIERPCALLLPVVGDTTYDVHATGSLLQHRSPTIVCLLSCFGLHNAHGCFSWHTVLTSEFLHFLQSEAVIAHPSLPKLRLEACRVGRLTVRCQALDSLDIEGSTLMNLLIQCPQLRCCPPFPCCQAWSCLW